MQFPDLYRFPSGHPPSPVDHPVRVTDYSGAAGDVELLFQDLISDEFDLERYDRELEGTRRGTATLPSNLTLVAVGWLEEPRFEVGGVPETMLDRLLANRDRVFSDGSFGSHRCAFCNPYRLMPPIYWRRERCRPTGHGHYLIQHGDKVYMAPELLPHYLVEHSYKPPEEFILAVSEGKFMQTADLVVDWGGPMTVRPPM